MRYPKLQVTFRCDKKKEFVCDEVLGKCERASEQCEREKKEACWKPRHWFVMEPIDKVIGERQPDFTVVDRPGKKIDPGFSLMTGVWVVLGGLANTYVIVIPFHEFPNTTQHSDSCLWTHTFSPQ